MIASKIIKSLPQPLKQRLRYAYGAIPPSIRYGKTFWDTYNFLNKSQWWSRDQLEEYQMKQLSALLNDAYKNIPHYRRVFDERGLKPEDIKNIYGIRQLPYLTKDMVREITKTQSSKGHLRFTTGTSGQSLYFYEDKDAARKEFAFICHQWARVGFKPGDATIQMRGSVDSDYYDTVNKILCIPPVEDNWEAVVIALNRMESSGAKYLHGYAGAITNFALMVKRYGLIAPYLKAVLLASENVTGRDREIIGVVFDCRVYSHYGLAEKTVLAGECEYSHDYHCLPQVGITEIDPATHEIIATGFLNHVTPFIRYRTGDIASEDILQECEGCGRHYYPVIKSVDGRVSDFVVTPEGKRISSAALTFILKGMDTIRNTKIVQETANRIVIDVAQWGDADSHKFGLEIVVLSQRLQKIVGGDMEIAVDIVGKIEPDTSGKFRWVENRVGVEEI